MLLIAELGSLVSKGAGHAACLDPKLCGAFRGGRSLTLPWPPLPPLMTPSLRAAVDDEGCGRRRSERSILLFFRGAIGSSAESQVLAIDCH